MLTVSKNACRELAAYFADKGKSPIRVFLALGGCDGPRLALALDEPASGDSVFEKDGMTFSIENSLLDQTGPIDIDLTPVGFPVRPARPANGCCGSGGDCGGCGGGCGFA